MGFAEKIKIVNEAMDEGAIKHYEFLLATFAEEHNMTVLDFEEACMNYRLAALMDV